MNDRFAAARAIANAVLYEGYLLYPYTASAQKNQMRWQFGVVVPTAYEAAGTGSTAISAPRFLVEASDGARVEGLVRFLHVQTRGVEAVRDGSFEAVSALDVDGTQHLTFDEAVEREVPFSLDLAAGHARFAIAFPASETVADLRDAQGLLAGRVVRRQWALAGTIEISALPIAGEPALRKLRLSVVNDSDVVAAAERGAALRTSFISTHTLLGIEGGSFLSPIDPPDAAVAATESLANLRTWPVLMGDAAGDAHRSALALSSPIILGDFPEVAKKTDTDHFDATEIDELLTLSVLSLSDAERAEARATDPRARAIVDRAEAYGAADVLEVHEGELVAEFPAAWRDLAAPSGTLFPDPRNRRLIEPTAPSAEDLAQLRAGDVEAFEQLPPASLEIGGVAIEKGSKVRLSPKRRADSWDMFLRGKVATVRTIHQDFEDKLYVAVTIDDDPATELHDWYGRSFFFEPDEVEPVEVKA